MLYPPRHLRQELAQLRAAFDEYVRGLYLAILDCLTLRDGITKEAALEYFFFASEMFNEYFQRKAEESGNYRELIEDHEGRLSTLFDIMFYGVAKETAPKQP